MQARRRAVVPGRDILHGRAAGPYQLLHLVAVGLLEEVVAAQDLGHLAEQRAELAPVERDLVEAQDGLALAKLARQPHGIELEPRRRQPRLDAPLHHDELDLHVDGARQFGLRGLELPEGGQLGGVGALRPRSVRLGHRGSVALADGRTGDDGERQRSAGDAGSNSVVDGRGRTAISDVGGLHARGRPAGVKRCFDILMVVSEALPYSKTGGLGDVGGALPAALARLGHHVTVVTPRYRGVEEGEVRRRLRARLVARRARLPRPRARPRRWRPVLVRGLPGVLRPRGALRGPAGDYPDNDRRFALLARAALECAASAGMRPAIVHAHDWQAGLVPAYLRDAVRAGIPRSRRHGTVFTIHNLAYQGIFGREVLPRARPAVGRVHGRRPRVLEQRQLPEGRHQLLATIVTTVSRRYAQEIQTRGAGLRIRRHPAARGPARSSGFRNGIDTDGVEPGDGSAPAGAASAPTIWRARRQSKRALLARVRPDGAGRSGRPAHRHGVAHGRPEGPRPHRRSRRPGALLALDASFVILGTGDAAATRTCGGSWPRSIRPRGGHGRIQRGTRAPHRGRAPTSS